MARSAEPTMEPFVEQLKQLCRAHPTRAKWIFVPSHRIGRTLGDRLVLEGTDWANLRFVTPFDIALRMGAPFLVERGIDPSEEGLGPALMMRLLVGLGGRSNGEGGGLDRRPVRRSSGGGGSLGEGGHFREQAQHPELAHALWTTVTELRMAGLRAANLTPDAFSSPAKHAELQALVAAYETFLQDSKRGDRATVFEEAPKHPDWCPIQPQDCWTELPDVIWSPLERRLIDSMPGERIKPDTLKIPEARIPRRLKDAPSNRLDPDTTAPLAFLLAPEQANREPRTKREPRTRNPEPRTKEPRNPGTPEPRNRQIALFQAGGAEAEIDEVFRRVLKSGRSLDEVEIACASPASQALVWEKACRHDWPVTLASGIPIELTRPARALLAFIAWIDNDFSAGALRRLLQSDDVNIRPAEPAEPAGPAGPAGPAEPALSPAHAARLLAKSGAAWGRRTYFHALGTLARGYRTEAAEIEMADDDRKAHLARAEQVDRLLGWITPVIDSVPQAGANGRLPLAQLITCALEFVRRHAATANALDGAAVVTLDNSISQLTVLGDITCSLADGLRFLRERATGLSVGASRPIPGHLHVSPLAQAAFSARRHLFIVGLQEGGVFPGAFEDPILLDAEREKISPLLRVSGDRIEEAVFAVLARLAAASAAKDTQICLSYSCRDLREYRQTHPSWLMLQAHRVATGRAKDGYKELEAALGDPKSCVPADAAEALSASGWWLNGVTRASTEGRTAVLREFPALEAGIAATEARETTSFTEYDGHVPKAGDELDPCSEGVFVSATQLEKAAACPFRHFVERGLGVRALEDADREPDVWLDPATRGGLLHGLYAALMRRCRDEKRRAKVAKDVEWLRALGREELNKLADEMPPPTDEVYQREVAALMADLDLFVTEEAEGAETDGRTPIGFEVGFGKGSDDSEPLAQDEPIIIDLGHGLKVRLVGRIDRIDQIGPKSFEVIDYKTGGFWPDNYAGTFAGGTLLQHALYGLAAEKLLQRKYRGAKVVNGVYYHPSVKGGKERVPIEAPAEQDTRAMLRDLRDVIAKGLFVQAPDKDACKFCDLGPACNTDQAGKRSKAKVDTDAVLKPYVVVTEHD